MCMAVLLSTLVTVSADAQIKSNGSQPSSGVCWRTTPHDNPVLGQIAQDDQVARTTGHDPSNDSTRRARMLALYHTDSVQTPMDFANAGLVLQHGNRAEHYLLAYELFGLAAAQGCGAITQMLSVFAGYRMLESLGLNEDVATQGSSNVRRQSPGSAAMTPVLTLDLVTRVLRLDHALDTLQHTHPNYPWGTLLGPKASPDSKAQFLTQYADVSTRFHDTALTVDAWTAAHAALRDATMWVSFQNMQPIPMRPVTGTLARSALPPVAQRNMTFVRAHQAQLAALGLTLLVPYPVTSELARPGANMSAVSVLPPDLLAPIADQPCVANTPPSTSDTAVTDNPDLRSLAMADQAAWRTGRPDLAAAAHRAQVTRWIDTDTLHTPNDLLRAALILEHSMTALDLWRANTLAWKAAFQGCGQPALHLAATTEDRFLALLGLTQRFGTLPKDIIPLDTGPFAVTPRLRAELLDSLPLVTPISTTSLRDAVPNSQTHDLLMRS
jgi:hypothetical protein